MGQRLDKALLARGLARSRTQAQALIAEGKVMVDGHPAHRPSQEVAGEELSLAPDVALWVSRAALKLVHALDHFDLSPAGAVAADIGASTGGFTEVLLDRGASEVHAIDVGHDQMAARLRKDRRVRLREGVNARDLGPGDMPPLDWVVADLSFISATKALPGVLACARPRATLVCLVKPQFEVGPARVGKGGIVRDPTAQVEACTIVLDFVESQGWTVLGLTQSPIEGGDGNVEFLLAARKRP